MTGTGSLAVALAELASEDMANLSNVDIGGDLRRLLVAVNQLNAQVARRLAVFDRAGLSVDDGCRSSAAWLRAFGRMSGSSASGWVRRARLCTQLPVLDAAAVDGAASAEHVDRVVRLVRRVGAEPVARVEPVLARAAAELDPVGLGRVCDRVVAHVDPDGAEPRARRDFERRGLTLAGVDGMVVLRGQLDAEGGAALSAALDALMTAPGHDELRTAAQRRADALAELARGALREGRLPTVGGVRPQVAVLLPPDVLYTTRRPAAEPRSAGRDASPAASPAAGPTTGPHAAAKPPPTTRAEPAAHGEAAPAPHPGSAAGSQAQPAGVPPVTPPAEWVVPPTTPPHAVPPTAHSDRGQVWPPAPPSAARGDAAGGAGDPPPTRAGHPPAWLEWIGEIPDRTAQRIACDADVWRAILDPATGQPLDVGRAHRLVPHWIRKALLVRDRGCRFPGCHAPPAWTDAHHLTPWAHGGRTDLTNLLMLCRWHHGLIHEGGWSIHYDTARNTVTARRPNGNPYEIHARPSTLDRSA